MCDCVQTSLLEHSVRSINNRLLVVGYRYCTILGLHTTTAPHSSALAPRIRQRRVQCVTAAASLADMEDDEVMNEALGDGRRAGKPVAAGHGMSSPSSGEGHSVDGHEPPPHHAAHASASTTVGVPPFPRSVSGSVPAPALAGVGGSTTSHLPFVAPSDLLRVSRSSRPSSAAARDQSPLPSPMTPLDREQIEGLVSGRRPLCI